MIVSLLLGLSFASFLSNDTLIDIQKQLQRDIIKMEPPPNLSSNDTCFHYSELIKVEVNSYSKVTSITFSDSAPDWMRISLMKLTTGKNIRIDFNKLNLLVKKSGLKKCLLLFPFIMESPLFPCGASPNQRKVALNYFQFKGEYLKGNIIFGRALITSWLVQKDRESTENNILKLKPLSSH